VYRYSLDVYISHVIHYGFETVSPTYLNDCCIGFRLWDYPLIYVQSNDGQSHMKLPQREFEESLRGYSKTMTLNSAHPEIMKQHKIRFDSGKSCMFKMTNAALTRNLTTSPLYIFLFVLTLTQDNQVKPNLIGSVSIPIVELDLSNIPDENGTDLPKRVISGTYNLISDKDYNIGLIDLDVRLRKLPHSRISDFSTNLSSFNETMFHAKTMSSAFQSGTSTTFSLQRPMSVYDNTQRSTINMQRSAPTLRPQSASTTVPASLVLDQNMAWGSRTTTSRSPLEGNMSELGEYVIFSFHSNMI
jgi:hypothetical protein